MASYELRIVPDIGSPDVITEVIESDTCPQVSAEGGCVFVRYGATVRAFVTERFYAFSLREDKP
jgi:hypothetical protein